MPKLIKQRWPNVNEVPHQPLARATGPDEPQAGPSAAEISRVMSALGRKGGKVGGKRRLETMSKAQRTEAARKAAQTRWRKQKG